MRRLVVSNVMSLDGYVDRGGAAPGLPLASQPQAEAFNATNAEHLAEATTLLAGRTTYQMFEGYWPPLEHDESTDSTQREISRLNNHIDKVVVSDSYTVAPDSPWAAQTTVVRRDAAAEAVGALKASGDGTILTFGSATTWNGLAASGVVDELRLLVTPLVLGAGQPAFSPDLDLGLELTSSRPVGDSGCVLLIYSVG